MSLPSRNLDRFIARLRQRLAAGAREYGDVSFTRPAAELIDEIQQELEDVCGWAFILWLRLDRQRAAASLSTATEQQSMARPLITGIEFTRASRAQARTGLLGWVSCILSGEIQLDGIAVRRTRAGRITLSFPEHRDRHRRRHPMCRPLTDEGRERLEDEILSVLPPDIASARRAAVAHPATDGSAPGAAR